MRLFRDIILYTQLIKCRYLLLLRGGILQSVPCTAVISDLSCFPIWFPMIPDSSTTVLWQKAESPIREVERNLARNIR
jgi:hypothetical protein